MNQQNEGVVREPIWPNPQIATSKPIKVVGVGGFGCKLIRRITSSLGLQVRSHVGELYIDSDLDAPEHYLDRPTLKLHLGDKAVSTPDEARIAAEAAHHRIRQALGEARMVIIVSALGGVTGSGATAVVARIANQVGILTICIFTYPHEKNPPFPAHFSNNAVNAEYGLTALRRTEGALVEIREKRRTAFWGPEPEETQLDCVDDIELWAARYSESFSLLNDEVTTLLDGFTTDVVALVVDGFHCSDFEDLQYVMQGSDAAAIGVATCGGKNRLKNAIQYAARGLLGRFPIEDSSAVFLMIAGSKNQISIGEQKYALRLLRKELSPKAHISYGYFCDPSLGGFLRICLLAAGAPNT